MTDIEVVSFGVGPLEGAYVHFKYEKVFTLKEQAEKVLRVIHEAIRALENTHTIYLRVPPNLTENREFDKDTLSWIVKVRMSLTLPDISGKPAGVLNPWFDDVERNTRD